MENDGEDREKLGIKKSRVGRKRGKIWKWRREGGNDTKKVGNNEGRLGWRTKM